MESPQSKLEKFCSGGMDGNVMQSILQYYAECRFLQSLEDWCLKALLTVMWRWFLKLLPVWRNINLLFSFCWQLSVKCILYIFFFFNLQLSIGNGYSLTYPFFIEVLTLHFPPYSAVPLFSISLNADSLKLL